MIDEMTLFDAQELCSYFSRHPPTHMLVAAFLGLNSDEPARQSPRSDEEFLPLGLALAGVPGMEAAVDVDLPPPIFDVSALMGLRPNR